MNPKLLESMRHVIDYLDDLMRLEPSRELADISNYLENILTELKERK